MNDTAQLPQAPEVIQTEVGMLQNFCELLYCPTTREAAVVDPAFEVDRLLRLAREHHLAIKHILITHTHHDHIEGVADMVAATGAAVFVHPHEAPKIKAMASQVVLLSDRMDVAIGACGVRALETFGHTPGGTCFLADGYIVTGDVLFVGGCGRTDFPGGSTAALWQSLNRLMGLPEETVVYPGHNYGSTPTSTMGREILENPYLRAADYEAFRSLRERVRKA
ncbi:MAG: MBL fold metallo-hydrolase [Deltaproteobacteria bacterium]|nr:MBL fold metallo-hydrolase [Deltaproteobacteria bacterium]